MMGTSPPMQNAPTVSTLSPSSVAAPASAAFPPAFSIFVPASLAASRPETTMPLLPTALLGPLAGWGAITGAASCAQARDTVTRPTIRRENFKSHLLYCNHRQECLCYHESRSPSCVTRALLPEFRVLRTPVSAIAVGLFGWLNTLKKSRLKRSWTLSVIFQNLNAEASWNHCHGPSIY